MYVLETFFRNDTIYTYSPGTARPTINGTDGPDVLDGTASDDIITGRAGDDTLTGGLGADEFHFERGFGHDTITDFAPGDTIWLDRFSIAPANSVGFEMLRLFIDPTSETLRIKLTWNGVTEQLDVPNVARTAATAAMFRFDRYPPLLQPPSTNEADTLFAFNYLDAPLVFGVGGDDILVGTPDNGSLYGGEGNDLFYEWGGYDTLVGGPGIDTAIYAAPRSSYRVGLAGDTILVQATYGTATLTEIEAMRFADTGTITLAELRADTATEEAVTRLVNGTPSFLLPTAYAGPLALAYQFAGSDAGDVMAGTTRNDFVNLGTGDDAADMGAGDDIVDGGTGSNFLTGGAGNDTFFVDGRANVPVWTTITDFTSGEQVALWGWQQNISNAWWEESNGVPGFTGVTFHADLDGDGTGETLITFAGLGLLQAPLNTSWDGLLWFQ